MRRRLLALAVPMAFALGLACKAPPPPRGDEAPMPALDPAALDRSVPPCEDFYAFACGGWIAATPLPPDRVLYPRAVGELEERNARALRRILEDARGAGKGDARDRALRKAGDFYAACMDEAAVNARGLADLLAEWAAIDAVEDRGELVRAVAHLAAQGLDAPFSLGTTSPGGAGARSELLLVQDGLTLPGSALYLDGAAEAVRAAYLEHVGAMLALAGVAAPQAAAQAAAVVAVERSLAPQGDDGVARPAAAAPGPRSPRPAVRLTVDRAGLQRLAPTFPWTLFFEEVGVPWPERIALTDPDGLGRAGELFEQAPLESWKAYLRWRVTAAMADARALPAAMVDERFRFLGAAFGGPPYQRPRWKDCVAATERALGPVVDDAFVRRIAGADRRERAAHLAVEAERALDAALRDLPWMDAPTRARARDKLGRVTIRTGGPEAPREDASLRVARDSYFRNVLSAGHLEVRRRLEQVGRPAEREWKIPAASVEPAYDPVQNALLLPAGGLQPPFLEPDAPDELRQGVGGAAVAEALVGVLDAGTARRDGDGAVHEWWSPGTAERFDAVAACLAAPAAGGSPGADAAAAAREALTDRLGVRVAWAALQAARAGRPATRKFHGLTPDQQFFVAYAQARCTARREDDRGGERPAHARVNGVLSSAPEFAVAFGCKEGTPMVRPLGARCGELTPSPPPR